MSMLYSYVCKYKTCIYSPVHVRKNAITYYFNKFLSLKCPLSYKYYIVTETKPIFSKNKIYSGIITGQFNYH